MYQKLTKVTIINSRSIADVFPARLKMCSVFSIPVMAIMRQHALWTSPSRQASTTPLPYETQKAMLL